MFVLGFNLNLKFCVSIVILSFIMEEGEGGDCGRNNVPLVSEFVVAASPAAGPTAWLDAPAKKPARQLDFNVVMEQSKPPQLQTTTVTVQKSAGSLPLPPMGLHASVRVG